MNIFEGVTLMGSYNGYDALPVPESEVVEAIAYDLSRPSDSTSVYIFTYKNGKWGKASELLSPSME